MTNNTWKQSPTKVSAKPNVKIYQPKPTPIAGGEAIEERARVAGGDILKPLISHKFKMPAEINPPFIIFQTIRNMNDYSADDLKYGDMTKGEIMALSRSFNAYEFERSPRDMFRYFKDTAAALSFGRYESVMMDLVDHMKENTGRLYSSKLLNQAMQEHETTKAFSKDIGRLIANELRKNKGVLVSNSKEVIQSDLMKNSALPKFNSKQDRFNGMALSIHDVFSVCVILLNLNVSGGRFKATLSYKVQDHFGLDKGDVGASKPFRHVTFFRNWFILQRYNEFGYKPFITEMNFNIDIEGVF